MNKLGNTLLTYGRRGVRRGQGDLLRLNLLRDLHDKVRGISLVIMSGDEVVEPDEAKRKVLGLRVLQALQNDLHDGNEVWFQRGPSESRESISGRKKQVFGTYGGKVATTVSSRSNP